MPPKKAASAAPEQDAEEPKVEEEPPPEVLEGDFQLPDGSSYSGEYIVRQEHPLMHGKGKLVIWPEAFEGTFHEGLYKEGAFKGADGSVYSGGFHNNLFHGPGDYTWADGRVYRGMWQEGLMHGRGEFENFSFGVDRLFEGFSTHGKFLSSLKGQQDSRRAFLAEYAEAYTASARAALQEIAARVAPAEPGDAKGKKPAEEGTVEWPKEYMVPAESESDEEASRERSQVLELVAGPFPDEKALKPAAFAAFAGCFAEGAEQQAKAALLEARGGEASLEGFEGARLQREQLGYVGQGVALSYPGAEPGAVKSVVLVNVSPEFLISAARWKLVHVEEAPVPVEESSPAAAPVPDKAEKGKKK